MITAKEVVLSRVHYYYGQVEKTSSLGYCSWSKDEYVSIIFTSGYTWCGLLSDPIEVDYNS